MSVTVKYKGSAIAEITESVTKTLKTSGKYCEADIVVENTKDGGGAITDGIVVKAVNDNNFPTEVDIYGEYIHAYMFGASPNSDTSEGWKYLETVNLKSAVKTIGEHAFAGCNAYSPSIPNGVQNIGSEAFRSCGKNTGFEIVIPDSVNNMGNGILRNAGVSRYIHKNARNLYRYGSTGDNISGAPFLDGSPTQYCQYGDIGYTPVTDVYYQKFPASREGLTMVIYTVGTAVDNLLTEFRKRNTTSVFVAKAAEDTTYNNVAYAAGETILTSEGTP